MDINKKFINLCVNLVELLKCAFPCCTKTQSHTELDTIDNDESLQAAQLLNDNSAEIFLKQSDVENPPTTKLTECKNNIDNVSLTALNGDVISRIFSFLSLKDLAKVSQTCHQLHNSSLANETALSGYARQRYGIFFANTESKEGMRDILKVMDVFYSVWTALTSKDKKGTKHNFPPDVNKSLSTSFEKFKALSVKGHKWVSLYLAIMYHYGFGTAADITETKNHIQILKNIWGQHLSNEFKRPENLDILANIVLTHFYESSTKDITDKQFYETELSVLSPAFNKLSRY